MRGRMAVMLAAGLAALAGVCETVTTVRGRVALVSGTVGDVRSARIEFYEMPDLSGQPVAAGAAADTGTWSLTDFEVRDVPAGSYYLLAWQDLDNDGRVSDGDLAGLRGVRYQEGLGGEALEVVEGQANDAGVVELAVYLEPLDTVSGSLAPSGDTAAFRYSFKHDLELTALSIAFPGIGTLTDPEAAGFKLAGVTYESGGWSAGGEPMPTGIHVVSFRGVLDSSRFDVQREVDVR
jgi:hypothetical protein